MPETAQDEMRHPSTKALLDYWMRLKGRRAAPGRGEIDPRALAAHLGDILLLDAAESGHALRLAGSRMEAELGGALVGTPFGALFSEESRRTALQALSIVTMEREPLLLGVRLDMPETGMPPDATRPDAGQWVRPQWTNLRPADTPPDQRERRTPRLGSGELLLLPLEHRGVVGARVLGAFGLNTPSLHLPAQRIALKLTSERVLGASAMALRGTGLARATTLVARNGIVQLFRASPPPGQPQNDS